WFDGSTAQPPKTPAETLLEVRGLTYSYDGEKNVLEDVSFDIKRGEFVSVLGKNGSGKSTITKLIMGVIEADSGSMSMNGQDLNELRSE
ncbi:ATP-binding cassette domain-containing protein, partial [Escherichia coli]|nr:ATP-binding cassette domain-containing protein [Escherichia coli]